MRKELTSEELVKYPLISLPLRRQKYDEVIEKFRIAYDDGKTVDKAIEEIITGVVVRIVDKQDAIDYYNERQKTEKKENETAMEEAQESTPEEIQIKEIEEDFTDFSEEIEKLEKELPNDDEEVIPNKTVNDITSTAKAIMERQITRSKSEGDAVEMEIADEDLEDWERQDFPMYDEEEKESMKNSIAIHGIIERLIVRPIKNKEREISNYIW